MAEERTEFTRLMDRLQAGDPAAVAELYERYGGVVREAVRRRLPDRLRKEYDSLDFAQDVWASFCRLPRGRYQFPSPTAFGQFLTRVAYNKVIDICRQRFQSQARDINREQQVVRPERGGYLPAVSLAVSREPSPSQLMMADERWEAIAAALPPHYVAVVERIREGYTHQEIAGMVGITDRTVRRIVAQVHRLCEGRP